MVIDVEGKKVMSCTVTDHKLDAMRQIKFDNPLRRKCCTGTLFPSLEVGVIGLLKTRLVCEPVRQPASIINWYQSRCEIY